MEPPITMEYLADVQGLLVSSNLRLSILALYLGGVLVYARWPNAVQIVSPSVRFLWNSCLAVFALLGAAHLLPHQMSQVKNYGFTGSVCMPLTRNSSRDFEEVLFWLWAFVDSKLLELGDTILLMLSGRSLSFLHVFHHSSTLLTTWLAYIDESPPVGMSLWIAATNYLVHVFMYTYFALQDSSLDDRQFMSRFAMRLTTFQIAQFVFFLFGFGMAILESSHGNPCQCSPYWIALLGGQQVCFLILFLRFADSKYGLWVQLKMAYLKHRSKLGDAGISLVPTCPWNNEGESYEQRFHVAAKMLPMYTHIATDTDFRVLYGAFKQVLFGPLSESNGRFSTPDDPRGLKKREAWSAMGNTNKEEACKMYLSKMTELRDRSVSQAHSQNTNRKTRHYPVYSEPVNFVDRAPDALYKLRIGGIGVYLPDNEISNCDIQKKFSGAGSSDPVRLGVKTRRWANIDRGEHQIQNAARAIRSACKDAGVQLEDIDLIINASGTPHQVLPDDSCLIQRELGLGNSGSRCFSVHSTCLSFVVGLETAGSLLRSGNHQCIAIVSSCVSSSCLRDDDAHTFGLFGDGAAAVIAQPSRSSSAIHRVHFETYGNGSDCCKIAGGGTYRPPHHPESKRNQNMFEMDGPSTLKLVSAYLSGSLERMMTGLSQGLTNVELSAEQKIDIDWVVPHQASGLALDSLECFNWPANKILRTLSEYGNCVAASIPLTLWYGIKEKKIQRGDNVLLVGTSAGISLGGMLLTY